MKTSNKIITDIELCRSEIENKIQDFQRIILEQKHKIEDLENEKETELDSIFKDLLSVIDAFDKADRRLAEQYSENEDIQKARKRFATSKKKLLEILNKNNVNEILFPDGLATLEDCQVEDTEPDSTKPNNTIISIEKAGYRRNGRLLRLAEVIVVKN
ncbi:MULTISPECIES: nucleotide exchange factor GrpE [unclassified Bacteroides]|uniref:nucleotide exchange factor GrpE n=1 Tax=unclassified Bacteroides TaxID=2646097 RepID=UPI001C37CE3B|nr:MULTISPECIES: nucleotide exchange factor GrpE [unclassified Bacteroides]MBV3659645.1 nucleotide exchange factor GrpE [Bacteroides sp. MSK.18.91]MBV3670097.1 nucleotide exchange factor GrpE [Bacteroides sp. MSK.18.83]MBV3713376.1 nucleotide exchange factor GrpE [Bacteroides sp. MSK.18.39]MBV3741057.1 nucleotide exchange factor GrpE [Bacteroides sp. MSK.18.37]MBV3757199.1 nucleotide exchange factor GrpE [Bacteroides sp. MSK.18.22]